MTPDTIEMVLDGSGLSWSRREDNWAVTAPEGVARELLVGRTEKGLKVDAVLVEWDEAGPGCLEALEHFRARAEKSIRGIRCRIDGTLARIEADVPADEVESKLEEALLAVSAGCRFLAREARALLDVELARAYVAFHKVGEPGASV
jgi:hypothetical protein